jgi:hypothetical protein
MIEILPDSHGTILGIRATGKLTDLTCPHYEDHLRC